MTEAATSYNDVPVQTHTMHRTLNWTHAFWFASGTPVLVLFFHRRRCVSCWQHLGGSVDASRC